MDLLIEKAQGTELLQVIIGTYEEYLIGLSLNYDQKTVRTNLKTKKKLSTNCSKI